MNKFLQSVSGHRRGLIRFMGSPSLASASSYSVAASSGLASEEEHAKRNYASNVSEYNTVLGSLISQRRHFLLRDVYEDMLLDGVQPIRDTFHSLIVGTMKGSRMQDAFFFRDEMKAMGLVPDKSHCGEHPQGPLHCFVLLQQSEPKVAGLSHAGSFESSNLIKGYFTYKRNSFAV